MTDALSVDTLRLSMAAVKACAGFSTTVDTTLSRATTPPVAVVSISAPVPVSNGRESWGAKFTLSVAFLGATRSTAYDGAQRIYAKLIALWRSGWQCQYGWISHLATINLPAQITLTHSAQAQTADNVFVYQFAVDVTARAPVSTPDNN